MTELQSRSIEESAENIEKYEKSAGYYFIKRSKDLILSFIGIIAFFPMMLVVAIAIKLDSKGSVIFSQGKRVFCV